MRVFLWHAQDNPQFIAAADGYKTVSGSLTGIGGAISFDHNRNSSESLEADESSIQSGDSEAPMFGTYGEVGWTTIN